VNLNAFMQGFRLRPNGRFYIRKMCIKMSKVVV